MKCKLANICDFAKQKIDVASLDISNYISTENMMPNKAGIADAATLPNVVQTQSFEKGDTLVSNIRPYFKKIWYASFEGGCSNDVLVFRAKTNVNPRFLYYVLADDIFFEYATSTAKGTKMPRGDKKAILEYEVPDFSYKEQEKIANVLSALDDKIALNQQINKNLEEQAQAIFKAWFMDSPDRYTWDTGTFSEIIESTLGGDWGKESPVGKYTEMVYCIRGADIQEVNSGNKGKMPTRFILPNNYKNKRLIADDIVVEISGGSPTQSTGRVAAVTQSLLDRYDKGMVCTNFCRAIKPKQGYSMFIYYYWQFLYKQNVFFSYENGTTGIKNLDLNGFISNEKIILPPQKLITEFDNICKAFSSIIFSNGLENERLANLRDALLPRLMSGEIDVSGIEV